MESQSDSLIQSCMPRRMRGKQFSESLDPERATRQGIRCYAFVLIFLGIMCFTLPFFFIAIKYQTTMLYKPNAYGFDAIMPMNDNSRLEAALNRLEADFKSMNSTISDLKFNIKNLESKQSEKSSIDELFCVNGHRVPNLFVIGAQKCGTTLLAEIFFQRSRNRVQGASTCFDMSTAQYCSKEPHFFNHYENISYHDPRYVSLYPKCNTDAEVIFDATPNNIDFVHHIAKFYSEEQKRKLVFVRILCDPVKRYESAWNHCARSGWNWGHECSPDIRLDDQVRISIKNRTQLVTFGHYDEELENLRKHFPESKLVVISNKYFFNYQAVTTNLLLKEVEASMVRIPHNFPPANVAEKKNRIGHEAKEFMRNHYKKHVEKFRQFIEKDHNLIRIPNDIEKFMEPIF